MGVAYTRTPTSLTLIVSFRPTVIPSSHPNFNELARLASDPYTTEADIIPLLDIPTAITTYTGGEIAVQNGRLFYRGVEVKDNLAKIIIGFVKSGQPEAAEPFRRFLANCRANPDPKLVETIYDWCVNSNMPITPDGELIAWKIVQRDYKSKATGKRGKLDHSIGATVTEPREECDPNRNQTCSTGIHFCSLEYIEKGNYGSITNGDRIVAVVVNPQDITAIPTDYNLSKGRCCKLRVVGEVERQDQLRGFYDNSGKVYNGWTRAAPAPAPHTRFPVQTGDVWRAKNGQTVTVDRVTTTPGGRGCAYSRVPGGNFADTGEAGPRNRDWDFVELISEGTPTRKMRTFTEPLRVGDTVRLRDGTVTTLTKDYYAKTVKVNGKAKWASNGRNYEDDSRYGEAYDRQDDVIDVITKAKRAKRNAAGIAVGQVWKDRAGRDVTITSITGTGEYPVKAGSNVYTSNGRFNSASSTSQFDLVRLVKDVA